MSSLPLISHHLFVAAAGHSCRTDSGSQDNDLVPEFDPQILAGGLPDGEFTGDLAPDNQTSRLLSTDT